ncbi:MAG: hypothetical protein AAFV97_03610 [Bacteroidota bacterium]
MSANNHNPIIQFPKRTIHQSHDIYGRDSLSYQAVIIDCFKARLDPELLERDRCEIP